MASNDGLDDAIHSISGVVVPAVATDDGGAPVSPAGIKLNDQIAAVKTVAMPLRRRSSVEHIKRLTVHSASFTRAMLRGYFTVFGWTGIFMLVVIPVSAAWIVLMMIVQLHPNEVANQLMGTGDLDSGEFWLVAKTTKSLDVLSYVGYILSLGAYVYISGFMVFQIYLIACDATNSTASSSRSSSLVDSVGSVGKTVRLSLTKLTTRLSVTGVALSNRYPLVARVMAVSPWVSYRVSSIACGPRLIFVAF